jgi:hypothetical protein
MALARERPLSPIDRAADSIFALFVRAEAPFSVERARALAREIMAYGGLEAAIDALAFDEVDTVLSDALAYRALRLEQGNPACRIARLMREAQDLDARAEPAWAQAAELHGRAGYRFKQGDLELAGQFQARALAAETLAAGLEEQALVKRLEAADLKSGMARCRALRDLAA